MKEGCWGICIEFSEAMLISSAPSTCINGEIVGGVCGVDCVGVRPGVGCEKDRGIGCGVDQGDVCGGAMVGVHGVS